PRAVLAVDRQIARGRVAHRHLAHAVEGGDDRRRAAGPLHGVQVQQVLDPVVPAGPLDQVGPRRAADAPDPRLLTLPADAVDGAAEVAVATCDDEGIRTARRIHHYLDVPGQLDVGAIGAGQHVERLDVGLAESALRAAAD